MARSFWLIWDGECGMCSRFAAILRARDKAQAFQIVSRQNCPSPPMTPLLQATAAVSLVLVGPGERVTTGADAVFLALRQTGGSWLWSLLSLPPFIWACRAGYWLVARNRGLISKTFFGGTACGLENRYPEVDELPSP